MSRTINYFPINNSRHSENKDFFYNVTGVSKADLGQYNEALVFFSKAIEMAPNNFISYFNRASVKMHLGDINGARIDFKLSKSLAIGNRA